MSVPFFDGLDIFGPAAVVVGRANPVARKTRGFCAVEGLLTQRLGSRGAVAEASGVLFADDLDDLLFVVGTFEAYKFEGLPHDLIDSRGRFWPAMVLAEFSPGTAYQDFDGFACDYTATFLGLSLPTF